MGKIVLSRKGAKTAGAPGRKKAAKPKSRSIGDKRLLTLARFLERGKIRGKFNMASWASGWHGDEHPTCGTAACAFGWATTIPSFRADGLRMSSGFYQMPQFGELLSFDAAAAFFEIDLEDANALFDPPHADRLKGMAGRLVVAGALRAFVKARAITLAQQSGA